MFFGFQFVAHSGFNVYQVAILESHTLSKAWVTTCTVEVLISVEGDVAEPADTLGACAAKDWEHLVPHVNIYFQTHLNFE